MNDTHFIRRATAADVDQVTSLFRATVETINARDYTPEQVSVWAASAGNTENWLQKIAEQYFLVACKGNIITGYASITHTGYLDLLYVHKDFQRRGIARQLFKALEKYAHEQQFRAITAGVSITAKGFFEKYGFRVLARHENNRDGIILVNYSMEKLLH